MKPSSKFLFDFVDIRVKGFYKGFWNSLFIHVYTDLYNTLGLIYQSNVETSADPSAQINLRQSSRVIYETFVCRQSHRTKDRTLINVAAENNRHLNIPPLKTPRFRSPAPKVYDTEKHNPAKKRK